ncbi:type IV toxin-antitoxin system AbiEi family antitoxin (plasmid) [Rhizobium sp. CB3090]|uniref:type IV toxin-antitoxin system AbiEi family antitoxin domain-containing protein n=1 Tax=Rhizobium sp. CB3090 TaxID=3039156 RepID=UPI0024B0E516|nr:type IV toxin-antitoxin system AbiEi family antitoxin [Rhizobium sp. CB3090]WFU13162.1 type IV toxin-antitoxin system AbiEi family antitoxin [Rhizobium sp. CB3090]
MKKPKLTTVLRAAGDVIQIDDAARALAISRVQAAKTLSAWAAQGWLQRVGTGVYAPVSLDMRGSDQTIADAWLLVPALFGPAYIGGRTAAEYWDLTEQLFRDIVVFTARPIRNRIKESGGAQFTLRQIPESRIFGIKSVWREHTKVSVSDIDRTMLDILDDPPIGGGIQHVTDCLDRYLHKNDSKPDRLIAYADQLDNGAVFKRLGFLAERHPLGAALVTACKARLTKGYAKLDPTLMCDRVVTRWKLKVPASWIAVSSHD